MLDNNKEGLNVMRKLKYLPEPIYRLVQALNEIDQDAACYVVNFGHLLHSSDPNCQIYNNYGRVSIKMSPWDALDYGFIWGGSPQGHLYWSELCSKLKKV